MCLPLLGSETEVNKHGGVKQSESNKIKLKKSLKNTVFLTNGLQDDEEAKAAGRRQRRHSGRLGMYKRIFLHT